MADPLRHFLLGQHQQRVREAFLTVYRTLLRFYSCLYEDFMGPNFRLQYDNSENSGVQIVKDNVTKNVLDPFPSKSFSESLNRLLSHNIWRGKLDRVATCLQFVNIWRTKDTRPWDLVDCHPESHFFQTWQRIEKEDWSTGRSIEDRYEEVKTRLTEPGDYCDLFDQIVKSVQDKSRFYGKNDSMRKSDDDPYFIKVTDIKMLIHAVDNMSAWGSSFWHPSFFMEATLKFAKPDQGYPRSSEFFKARDREIIYTRLMRTTAGAVEEDITREDDVIREDRYNDNDDDDDMASNAPSIELGS